MDLTPAAWDFLADVARRWGMSWARVLRDKMGSGFIAELDGDPAPQTARQKPTEQLKFDTWGTT